MYTYKRRISEPGAAPVCKWRRGDALVVFGGERVLAVLLEVGARDQRDELPALVHNRQLPCAREQRAHDWCPSRSRARARTSYARTTFVE